MSEFLKENRERILEGYKKIKEQFPGVFEETDKQNREAGAGNGSCFEISLYDNALQRYRELFF